MSEAVLLNELTEALEKCMSDFLSETDSIHQNATDLQELVQVEIRSSYHAALYREV